MSIQYDGSQLDLSNALLAVKSARQKAEFDSLPPAPKTIFNKEDWPPNYDQVHLWRYQQKIRFQEDPEFAEEAYWYYADHAQQFINHWCDTYDPRNRAVGLPARIPLVMFGKQDELIDFILKCIYEEQAGLIEKSRDMGATWIAVSIAVWFWLFSEGAAIGFGSRKQELVDRIGDPSSIFEKIRMQLRGLPECFFPPEFNLSDHMHFMRIVNSAMGTSIIGETGDNIGRGGRTLAYFVDEAAHHAHPEMVEAALMDNTRSQIDMSSVSGLGSVFHRKREAGAEWDGETIHQGTTNVFILDWSDHPAKTNEWYKQRKTKAASDGLTHLFAREIDRDYAASVEGVIIPSEFVVAAIDAHVKLGIEPEGKDIAGLDVADSGQDSNAETVRKGILAYRLAEWSARDTAVTARKAVRNIQDLDNVELNYDCIGVGAGVKAEINNLRDRELVHDGMKFVPWNAAGRVLNPSQKIDPTDKRSQTNRDFYQNLKAQAWWEVGKMFAHTYRALYEEDFEWDPSMIISISSKLPDHLSKKLQKELSQATMGYTPQMKLIVNKAPSGTRSPNLADSFVMAYYPFREAPRRRATVGPRVIQ